MKAVLRHLVPVRSEHGDLGCHALIFTAGLLVEVVRYQNFHRREFPTGTTSIIGKLQPRDERFRPKSPFIVRLGSFRPGAAPSTDATRRQDALADLSVGERGAPGLRTHS